MVPRLSEDSPRVVDIFLQEQAAILEECSTPAADAFDSCGESAGRATDRESHAAASSSGFHHDLKTGEPSTLWEEVAASKGELTG